MILKAVFIFIEAARSTLKKMVRRKKALGIFLVFAGLVYFVYNLISEHYHSTLFEVPDCMDNESLFQAADYSLCIGKPQIYFVETSGSPVLNARQACAIESTALHNPSIPVAVLMTPLKTIDFSNATVKILKNISNVKLIRINIGQLSQGTPIQKWYFKDQWKKSKWQTSHLSDALRYLLLWKFGGIYLDMDIVTFRSLDNFKNTVISEDWKYVAAGLLFFDQGHELMKKCMNDFAEIYNPNRFNTQGPLLITTNIKTLCDTQDIRNVSEANCPVEVLPPEIAFPIPYFKWEEYFVPSNVTDIKTFYNSSYFIHVWNTFSKTSKLMIGTNSLYELAMRQHCPHVYEYAQTVGYV